MISDSSVPILPLFYGSSVFKQGKSGRAANKPFFDRECAQLKSQVRRASDPATKKALERLYHSTVRSKRRKYLQWRLQDLIVQKYSHPRSFWKLKRRNSMMAIMAVVYLINMLYSGPLGEGAYWHIVLRPTSKQNALGEDHHHAHKRAADAEDGRLTTVTSFPSKECLSVASEKA